VGKNPGGVFRLDPKLREFATDLQWERLKAWAECGGPYLAAAKLGISAKLVYQARDRVERAALRAAASHDSDTKTEWRKPTLTEEYGEPPGPAFVHGPVVEYTSRPDNTFLFGVVSDNHAGSKYERLDVLADLFRRFSDAGADRVFHAGNWIDGDSRFNTHDVHTRGMDAQIRHLIDIWPRVGLTTYAIWGKDHEGWYAQREGVDVGRYCEHRFRDHVRSDWIDLGFMEAHVLSAMPTLALRGLCLWLIQEVERRTHSAIRSSRLSTP
jgi:hypothetical protein